MQDEQIRFWQDFPRLKSFLKWLAIATCVFLVIFIFPLLGFRSNIIGLIMISGVFLFAVVWYIVVIIAGIIYLRWLKRQRYPKRPET
jgi:uncharacterized membrane protein